MPKTFKSVMVQSISFRNSRNMIRTVKSSVFVLVSVFSFALVEAALAADALDVQAALAAAAVADAPVAPAAEVAEAAVVDAADAVDAVLLKPCS
jgi:hypothetical protein